MKNDESKEQTEKAQEAREIGRRDFLMPRSAGAIAMGLLSSVGLTAAQAAQTARQSSAIGATGLEGGERGVFPGQTPATARISQGKKLKDLLARKGVVLAVLGVPDAAGAVKMEHAGCECAFIGTGLYFSRLGGVPDQGLVTATESIWVSKFLAEAVHYPLILDGDTGHGGPPAVKRLVRDCIRIGLAGLRIDDQEIEVKRSTGSGGIQVVSREMAIDRYKAAVEARNELDPNFVIEAQCYAREASNGGLDELLARIPLYENQAGVDWVQFTRPKTVDEIKSARAIAKKTFSAMKGDLPKQLSIKEHGDLGLNAAWLTGWPGMVQTQAMRAACAAFKAGGGVPYALKEMNG
jgi:2-methylisocitrate lyase-like PEP mutase family enzyme